jgi:hypothetical protein
MNIFPELYSALRFLFDEVEGSQHGSGNGRGKSSRIKEDPPLVYQKFDQRLLPGHEGAETPYGLSEGSNQNVDPFEELKMIACTGPTGSKDTEGMGVIDHEQSFIGSGKFYEFRERSNVSVHAEDAVCHNQFSSGPALFEESFQMDRISMGVDPDRGLAQSTPIDETGMVQLITENLVPLSHQRLKDREVGRIA